MSNKRGRAAGEITEFQQFTKTMRSEAFQGESITQPDLMKISGSAWKIVQQSHDLNNPFAIVDVMKKAIGEGNDDVDMEDCSETSQETSLDKEIEGLVINVIGKFNLEGITGLENEKKELKETLLRPLTRPELFQGKLRVPPKGILLHGPPGTGKTSLARGIAGEIKATFLSVSPSDIMSEWQGRSEKKIAGIFEFAKKNAPAVIFFDEIDALLSARSSRDDDSTRRLKVEFLMQMDGFHSGDFNQVQIIGATNRMEDLDTAALRPFQRKLFIGLPSENDRRVYLCALLKEVEHDISDIEIEEIASQTNGKSPSQLLSICQIAAGKAVQEVDDQEFKTIKKVKKIKKDKLLVNMHYLNCAIFQQFRPCSYKDFAYALKASSNSSAESSVTRKE